MRLGYVKTGHPMGPTTPKGTANAHFYFCAADIHAVDDEPVELRPIPTAVVDLGRMIMLLPPKLRPQQVMGPTPWHAALGGSAVTGFRDDDRANAIHHDHLHLGFIPPMPPE